MHQEYIKIPKERIAVLIGTKGKDKRLLEKHMQIKMQVDSIEGVVTLMSEDSFQLFLAKNVIKAIARGFSPVASLELLGEDKILEIINIQEFSGKSKSKLVRLKSRIIGSEGKARKTIQLLTNTNIVIYGKTISIIGEAESVIKAKKSIETLLLGSKHGTIYSKLERSKKKK